jgi:hypothetical protein
MGLLANEYSVTVAHNVFIMLCIIRSVQAKTLYNLVKPLRYGVNGPRFELAREKNDRQTDLVGFLHKHD